MYTFALNVINFKRFGRASTQKEYGKLVQKLLAIALLGAGADSLTDRSTQGIDLEATIRGKRRAIEVKTTETRSRSGRRISRVSPAGKRVARGRTWRCSATASSTNGRSYASTRASYSRRRATRSRSCAPTATASSSAAVAIAVRRRGARARGRSGSRRAARARRSARGPSAVPPGVTLERDAVLSVPW
jgi:hypothetical protein